VFTGIVIGTGVVVEVSPGRLGVEHGATAAALEPGGSVAVNGCCLTAIALEGAAFFADVVPETARRTNLGSLRPGDLVNLELPLRLDQGLDGHLLQGHVDGTAEVLGLREVAVGREVEVALPHELAPFVAEKGSVALDGTSLTVAGLGPASFRVALIPRTLEQTVAGGYRPGSVVNVEVDVVARYVHRLLQAAGQGVS
jgi:riboflavin synthase